MNSYCPANTDSYLLQTFALSVTESTGHDHFKASDTAGGVVPSPSRTEHPDRRKIT